MPDRVAGNPPAAACRRRYSAPPDFTKKPRHGQLSENEILSDKHGPELNSSGTLPPNREAYSVREVASALAVSEKSVYRLIARGLLKPLRALLHHRLTEKELQRFLA